MEAKVEENEIAFATLGMAMSYLQSSLLDEKVIKLSDFVHIGQHTHISTRMVIDAQALENLQIIDVQVGNRETHDGSLLGLINKCATKFGYRLLK